MHKFENFTKSIIYKESKLALEFLVKNIEINYDSMDFISELKKKGTFENSEILIEGNTLTYITNMCEYDICLFYDMNSKMINLKKKSEFEKDRLKSASSQ